MQPSAVAMTSHDTVVLTYRVPEELLADGAQPRLQAWVFGTLETVVRGISAGDARRCVDGREVSGYRIDFAVEGRCPETLETIVGCGPLSVRGEWVDLAWQSTDVPAELFAPRR